MTELVDMAALLVAVVLTWRTYAVEPENPMQPPF